MKSKRLAPIEKFSTPLYTAMGCGRKGPLEQSLKKPKNKAAFTRTKTFMVCGLKPNGSIPGLTPNEIKIAEQLTSQQLVDILDIQVIPN